MLRNGKPCRGVSDQVQHKLNQALIPQEMATGLAFRILEEKRLYYRCSENKVADRGDCAVDLCLCFPSISDEPYHDGHNKGTNQHAHSCIRISTFLDRKRL